MSFTNLTPDINPDGSRFPTGATIGIRYFYFTIIPTSPSIDVFLTRNIYINEEYITRLFTSQSPISLMTNANLVNVALPCVFVNGQITLKKPSGFTYRNTTNIPDFTINNLTVGSTYILETRTIYNDSGMDFGAYMKGATLKYIQASTVPITPNVPLPIPLPPLPKPVPPPVPVGLPAIPSGLVATNAITGVSLVWTPVTQTTQYLIYREELLLSSSATASYTDTQVVSGSPYTYKVSALNDTGESGQSAPRTITPMFLFTCLVPNKTPIGAVIAESLRYYYFLFTPITPSIDVFCYNGSSSTMKSIIGLYDTTDTSSNYFVASNLSKLDSNVSFGPQVLSSLNVDGLSVKPYRNTGILNFSINLPVSNNTLPSFILKTYILEIAAYSPDVFTPDFGVYFKDTNLNYNSVSITRGLPSPYILAYNFTDTDTFNYTKYIYPNLSAFQNAKSVLESIITATANARGFNRKNDMLVNFSITELIGDTIGESSLDKWKADATRSPDFTYEQSITFNSVYFENGYMTSAANFNGAGSVNTRPNINFFNIILHEILHGLGFFFTNIRDVGWNSFITDASGNAPWYKGPIGSSALSLYKTYCKSSALQRIPVEGNYGPGTALSHWDEGSTPTVPINKRYYGGIYYPAPIYEIMTGFIGSSEYMTGLTVGVLKDYGYSVNLTSPYVVAHPYEQGGTPIAMPASARVSCSCTEYDSKIVHKILVEKVLPNKEKSLFYYLQQIGYYTPVYF